MKNERAEGMRKGEKEQKDRRQEQVKCKSFKKNGQEDRKLDNKAIGKGPAKIRIIEKKNNKEDVKGHNMTVQRKRNEKGMKKKGK